MRYPILYRIGAALLLLGTLGHTLGGTLRTARRGPQAGAEADRVLADMRAVRFVWRGSEVSWFDFWMGNGLGVSALLVLAIVVLWLLGGDGAGRTMPLALGWTAFASLSALAVLGYRYFALPIGLAFTLVALLTGAAAALSTFAATGPA